MKTKLILLFLCFIISLRADAKLARFADLSENHIVFTYENDLWLADRTTGEAKRLTREDGTEIYAKFSPDGEKIAFTGNYEGGNDVYVFDLMTGELTRLTFHPASDLVLDWFPDGKHILFRSSRSYPRMDQHLYKINARGGTPEKLPVDRAGLASLSPDGEKVVYNRSVREFRTWKRYQGGIAQDLWLGSFREKNYRKITRFKGTDNFPMWLDHRVVFTSDREKGTLNLFSYDTSSGEITPLTQYDDFDVKYPSFYKNEIIYQYAGDLHIFNLDERKDQKVQPRLISDKTFTRDKLIKASGYVDQFALSPSGKRALFSIRGEIINYPVEEGLVKNLTRSSGVREKNPAWSPDGKLIAYWSDETGEEELYTTGPQGCKQPRRVTTGQKGFHMAPKWSPDSKHVLFHDQKMKLNLLEVSTGKISVIDQSDYDDAWERWGVQDYVWSPDSRWVAYAKMERSLYESIFLYSLDQNKTYRVTTEQYRDWSPSFSPDGEYLYFLSNRAFNPIMGKADQNHVFLDMTQAYLVLLNGVTQSPFAPKDVRENSPKSKDEKNKASITEIVPAGLDSRILKVPLPAGQYERLEATRNGFSYLKKTEYTFLKYSDVTDAVNDTYFDLYEFNVEDEKETKILAGVSQYHVSADKKKIIYKSGRLFGVIDAGKPAGKGDGKLDLNKIDIRVDRGEEFAQIFKEAWRIQRDWFYDSNMHGVNWEKAYNKYEPLVKFCSTRGDLNFLIGEMIAELNAGHTYVYGGDIKGYSRGRTGLLGASFSYSQDSPYPKVEKIAPGNNWDPERYSPLLSPQCPIKEGDYIIAINNEKIRENKNIYAYLQGTGGETIELTYNHEPVSEGAKKCLVKTLSSETSLTYHAWVEKNRKYVDEKTNGQVAYIHLPAMMENGLIEFAKVFYANYYKKGMIIDVRYNGGGFTSKMIMDRIERKLWFITRPREGKSIRDPERVFHGHYVLLNCADTYSDGELFSQGWKQRKIGPIVGERTWGGSVGIEAHQDLVDNGGVTPPQFGPYNLERKWVIEGVGVIPDMEVHNLPQDVLNGIDSQLDKSIEVVMDSIKNNPKDLPPLPEYPDKSKPSLK